MQNIKCLSHVLFKDVLKLKGTAKENSYHISKAANWLSKAQDATGNGGVSEAFHLFHGWLPSYPETTGYIIETFYDYSKIYNMKAFSNRALKMADWLISIQNDDGSFTDSSFKNKMVFDTGQIVFGLNRAFNETKKVKYRASAIRAGEWVISKQNTGGYWERNSYNNIAHTYYTRVAWSLVEIYELTKEKKYLNACLNNINWALKKQKRNGWFDCCSFTLNNHEVPFTHTIAYTLRGILEVGLYLQNDEYINSVKVSMDHLIKSVQKNGNLPGTFDEKWQSSSKYNCLTGSAQLAIILLKIFIISKDKAYFICAKKIIGYLKLIQIQKKSFYELDGAMAGSYPIWGGYIHYSYPNWATKFFIDALILIDKIELEFGY